ncbi:septal ring lytic transglycosylase RlpA family protein [Roseomonas xinghualingensis]|uniref:septal ring lytic transglycosylase RlpA family protein n=1 Tax=Roseomonas xinghualingensis TaxID=2986475 RepID=UPI0021F1A627|nr:RlpA-like double-psi beta-barrel domain-containing protein [Roseomonas sp. SXEYE001]MCV4209164.1 SPOR domain-containing protein [Roseomonas sp. SXEYE001]
MIRPAAVLGLLLLAGCWKPEPLPVAEGRYMVGEPYQLRNLWFYPREDFGLVETGLAGVASDARAGRRTSNGEVHDPAGLMAAHRTLQLPAVVTVTNLENGRSLAVRVNDRGPADPGRAIELSRRSAELLGILPGRPAQVRVAVEGNLSRSLASALPAPEGSQPVVQAAPTAAVQRETLAPIAGARQAERIREGRGPMVWTADMRPEQAAAPLVLPERVAQGPAMPGMLHVQGSSFTSRAAAQQQAARLGGARVESIGSPRAPEFRVRIGPFVTPAEADRALDGALRAGVSEARIIVD